MRRWQRNKAHNWNLTAGLSLLYSLDFGEAEIDDNLVENAIRPTCVGKRNWLFFGSEEVGTRNAVVFTLIQNCRLHGIDPYAYLKDILEKLPTTPNSELPN